MADKTYVFQEPTSLTRWAKGLLYATMALSVIGIISGAMELHLLQAIEAGNFEDVAEMTAAANANDARQGLVGIAQLVVFIATLVAVGMWIYRANQNAHALGAEGMRFSPGWSVGWYFIPIFNLWKPYQAMKEIWKASANPHDWQSQKRSPLLPWWWFLWILTSIVGQALLRLSLAAEEIKELMAASALGVAADAIEIPLDLLLIAIIGGIYRMQTGHAAGLAPESEAEPRTVPKLSPSST